MAGLAPSTATTAYTGLTVSLTMMSVFWGIISFPDALVHPYGSQPGSCYRYVGDLFRLLLSLLADCNSGPTQPSLWTTVENETFWYLKYHWPWGVGLLTGTESLRSWRELIEMKKHLHTQTTSLDSPTVAMSCLKFSSTFEYHNLQCSNFFLSPFLHFDE